MTPRVKKMITFAVVANVICATVYVASFTIIKNKNDATVAIQTEIDFQNEKIERLSSARKIVEAADSDAGKLASYGVETVDEQVKFISSIEALGRGLGVVVEVKNPSVEEGGRKDKDYFRMSVIAIGDWKKVVQFFSLIDSIPMDLHVRRLQFELKGDRGNLSEDILPLLASTTAAALPIWQADIEIAVLKFKN